VSRVFRSLSSQALCLAVSIHRGSKGRAHTTTTLIGFIGIANYASVRDLFNDVNEAARLGARSQLRSSRMRSSRGGSGDALKMSGGAFCDSCGHRLKSSRSRFCDACGADTRVMPGSGTSNPAVFAMGTAPLPSAPPVSMKLRDDDDYGSARL